MLYVMICAFTSDILFWFIGAFLLGAGVSVGVFFSRILFHEVVSDEVFLRHYPFFNTLITLSVPTGVFFGFFDYFILEGLVFTFVFYGCSFVCE